MGETFEVGRGAEALVRALGFSSVEAVFAWQAGERMDKPGLEGWRQRWRLQLTDGDGAEQRLYLKRFDSPPVRRQIERWCRGALFGSTGRIEWSNARALAVAGTPAVQPVAYGQQMVGPWERRSFVLLREVPGQSLERWVPANVLPASKDTDPRGRRRRLEALARMVAGFHRQGFVHRDLYLSHVFIEPGGDSFRLIDLQRVFRPRWRRRRWAVKDLAALDFSTPADRVGRWERLRFLCRYVRECDRFGSARWLVGRIAAKTARMGRRRGDAGTR